MPKTEARTLPSYCTAAALSSQTLFTRRALEKNKKHLNGCIDLGRHFLPLVFSSLGGLGPPESVEYLDRLYANAYATELRLGGHGAETHHQRTIFYQTLQAILPCSKPIHHNDTNTNPIPSSRRTTRPSKTEPRPYHPQSTRSPTPLPPLPPTFNTFTLAPQHPRPSPPPP